MGAFNYCKTKVSLFLFADFFIFEKSKQKIRIVFNAISPTLYLFILIFQGLPKSRSLHWHPYKPERITARSANCHRNIGGLPENS